MCTGIDSIDNVIEGSRLVVALSAASGAGQRARSPKVSARTIWIVKRSLSVQPPFETPSQCS